MRHHPHQQRHTCTATTTLKAPALPQLCLTAGHTPTRLIADAHSLGLEVHAWTFRAENVFLPNEFDSSSDPAAFGDMKGQILAFTALGLDGFFTDHPDLGVAAVASIPEPETYAMLLAGLALTGFMARRRKAG